MAQALGAFNRSPFTAKKKTSTAVKPKTYTPPVSASQRLLQMQNEQYAPSGPTTAPRVTQQRTNDTQPNVNPFSALATGSGVMPYAGAGSSPPAGTIAAAAAGAGGINNLLQSAGAVNAGNGAFPVGSGYTAQTKLGQSFIDAALPGAWDDPEALIDTFYRVNGMAKGGGTYGTQLESADNLGMLYMALMGDQALQGNGNFVDWASKYLENGRTADGRSISPGEIWGAITSPENNSPLNYYLNNPSLTPEDQVNNFMSAARYGMESTLPGPILNAVLAQIDQMGREFRSLRNTQAGGSSFTDYMQSRPGSMPNF
jgi:hypothetical protein